LQYPGTSISTNNVSLMTMARDSVWRGGIWCKIQDTNAAFGLFLACKTWLIYKPWLKGLEWVVSGLLEKSNIRDLCNTGFDH
jgi:hypothetical protein